MMNANWNYPTAVRVGAGRVNELPDLCLEKGIKNPLLVTDTGLAALPMVTEIQAICEQAGLSIAVFSHVKSNPTGINIEEGVDAYRLGQHDGVIALGGGSALDVGKSIAVIAQQECTLWDLEDEGDNWQRAEASKIAPVIALPTTAGTGSEVGRASVIVHEQQQRKVIIFHPNMMPGSVILDPELTTGLPAKLTAATGMDALSHNLEAYCSPFYHPMAKGIAIEGIRLVKEHLPIAVAEGSNIEARTQMLVASSMGATAFQCGLGAMHALAHPLGAVYDAHHGMLNAVLMPYVLMANYSVINESAARLASYLDLEADFDALMQWVLDLRHCIGIPHALDALIPDDVRLDEIGEMAVLDSSSMTNPIQHSAEVYASIARNAFNGVL
jgi:alcohol dehydrogenase class IV